MATKTWLLWGLAITAALTITYTFAPQSGAELTVDTDRTAAPNFTLRDASGAEVSLADYKGKVVLLNFWATWCQPCRVEIPWFIEFEDRYKDQDFAVLGVDFDMHEDWDLVGPYVAEQKMNYKVVLMGETELPEPYYSIETLPTTLLIDRDGRIAVTHYGLVSKPTYEDGIEELL